MRASEEAIEELKKISGRDVEAAHVTADEILVRFVRQVGYPEVADAWEAVQPKWYA